MLLRWVVRSAHFHTTFTVLTVNANSLCCKLGIWRANCPKLPTTSLRLLSFVGFQMYMLGFFTFKMGTQPICPTSGKRSVYQKPSSWSTLQHQPKLRFKAKGVRVGWFCNLDEIELDLLKFERFLQPVGIVTTDQVEQNHQLYHWGGSGYSRLGDDLSFGPDLEMWLFRITSVRSPIWDGGRWKKTGTPFKKNKSLKSRNETKQIIQQERKLKLLTYVDQSWPTNVRKEQKVFLDMTFWYILAIPKPECFTMRPWSVRAWLCTHFRFKYLCWPISRSFFGWQKSGWPAFIGFKTWSKSRPKNLSDCFSNSAAF